MKANNKPGPRPSNSLFGRVCIVGFLLSAVGVHLLTTGPAVWIASGVLVIGAAILTLVPPVARFVLSRRQGRVGRKRLTRSGIAFLALTGVFGLSALNTGDNLLFLVFGMLAGGFLASLYWGRSMLQRWEVSRNLPGTGFCGEPLRGGVRITSTARGPLFCLEVRDELPWREAGAPCRFLHVAPKASASRAYEVTPARRGVFELRNVRVATRFPFGFVEMSTIRECPHRLVVFPKRVTVPAPVLAAAATSAREQARAAVRPREGHDEFHSLREYRPGDNPRRIHWRSTARHGKLILKVFENRPAPAAIVLLDMWGHEEGDALTEAVLSVGGSVMAELARRGIAVHVALRGPDLKRACATSGRAALHGALGILAGAQPSLGGGLEGLVAELSESSLAGRHVIAVARRREDRLPRRLAGATALYAEDWRREVGAQ